MEITRYGLEHLKEYPHGKAYDNLFNAEHRDIMVEKHGSSFAAFVSVEELASSKWDTPKGVSVSNLTYIIQYSLLITDI